MNKIFDLFDSRRQAAATFICIVFIWAVCVISMVAYFDGFAQ